MDTVNFRGISADHGFNDAADSIPYTDGPPGGGTEEVLSDVETIPPAPQDEPLTADIIWIRDGLYFRLYRFRPALLVGGLLIVCLAGLVAAISPGPAGPLPRLGFVSSVLMFTGLLWLIPDMLYTRAYDAKTRDKLARVDEIEQLRRRRDKLIQNEARRLARLAVGYLARAGFSRMEPGQRGAIKIRAKIRIAAIVCTRDAVYIKVDGRTPYGVRFVDLAKREIAEDLSMRLQRECWWEGTREEEYEFGLWLCISLATGSGGIARLYPWNAGDDPFSALNHLPESAKYTFIAGVTRGRKPIKLAMPDLPHLGVFGATNTGKSVFLNQLICTLVKRHTPRQLGLLMVDMKRVELSEYRSLPHLIRPICTDVNEVDQLIEWALTEMTRRYKRLELQDCRNIKEWNRKNPAHALKRILIIIDEWASVMLTKELTTQKRNKIEAQLTRIVQESRAVGIHVIVTTQAPKRSVLEGLLMANITTRVVFRMGDIRASMMALDTAEAGYIPDDPGRAVLKIGPDRREIKAPFISSAQIQQTINSLAEQQERNPDDLAAYIDPLDLIQYGIEHGYKLSDPLLRDYAAYNGYSVAHVRSVAVDMDYDTLEKKPVFDVFGASVLVYVVPGTGRKIIPVYPGNLPETEGEIVALYRSNNPQSELKPMLIQPHPAETTPEETGHNDPTYNGS